MAKKMKLNDIKTLAMANYEHGGDYLLEMMSDDELLNLFGMPGGKTKIYSYMRSVNSLRKNIYKYCVRG